MNTIDDLTTLVWIAVMHELVIQRDAARKQREEWKRIATRAVDVLQEMADDAKKRDAS